MKKYNPFHKYEIVRIMQWLNEQASLGWELKSWGSFFVKFEEANGQKCQYQIDMDDWEDGANEERRSQLEALGWKYVDTISGTRLHIYRSEDLKASIPAKEEFIIFNRKKLRFTPLAGLIGFLLTAGTFLLTPLLKIPFMVLELSRSNEGTLPFTVFFIIILVIQFTNGFLYDFRLYKYLDMIREVPVSEILRQGDHTKAKVPLRTINGIFIIAVVLILLRFELEEDIRNLSEADAHTKYVDLVEIQDENFNLSNITWTKTSHINRADCISYTDGFFVEQYYETWQSGYGPFGENEDLDGYYWVDVEEQVQEKLFLQILERYTSYALYYDYSLFNKKKYDTRGKWEVSEQADERFEKLFIAQGLEEYDDTRLVFAQIENNIVYLKYIGEKDVSVLIEELVKVAGER